MTNIQEDESLCPFCAETIKAQAVICKHCRSTLQQGAARQEQVVKLSAKTRPFPSKLDRQIQDPLHGEDGLEERFSPLARDNEQDDDLQSASRKTERVPPSDAVLNVTADVHRELGPDGQSVAVVSDPKMTKEPVKNTVFVPVPVSVWKVFGAFWLAYIVLFVVGCFNYRFFVVAHSLAEVASGLGFIGLFIRKFRKPALVSWIAGSFFFVGATINMGRFEPAVVQIAPSRDDAISKKANEGDPQAQFMMGQRFDQAKDLESAIEWYQLAAKQNHAEALHRLGFIYDLFQGEKSDPKKALEFYKRAARAGSKGALFDIAEAYETGRGVEMDVSKANKLYLDAANQGEGQSIYHIAVKYLGEDGVPENYYEAFRWFQKGANLGDGYCQFELAHCYESGLGVNENLVEAVKYYKMAADQNVPQAKENYQLTKSRLERMLPDSL